MEPEIRCIDCDWEGYATELHSRTDDLDDNDFFFFFFCGSENLEDTDYDEETDDYDRF